MCLQWNFNTFTAFEYLWRWYAFKISIFDICRVTALDSKNNFFAIFQGFQHLFDYNIESSKTAIMLF